MTRPKIVMFSGGSASRSINIALSGRHVDLTRIVPAWDSGGSSKAIRESFGVISVGDTRQALMTMAHGEGIAGDVVRICNTRLSGAPDLLNAKEEFALFVSGQHPLQLRLQTGIRGAIQNYLRVFDAHRPPDFDFTNGSIGNFILTGAYIAHNRDMNTAIFVFRKICGIDGNVWPSTIDNSIELNATLRDGRRVFRQHLVTSLPGDAADSGIASIDLTQSDHSGSPHANDAMLEAIREAELIIFGPGSFYTSILPHLLIDGVIGAVAENAAAKRVFIGNIVECGETRGRSLADASRDFAKVWWDKQPETIAPFDFLLANRELFPFKRLTGSTSYLPVGDIDTACTELGSQLVLGEFEDSWQRGHHDGKVVAEMLLSLP